MTPAPRPDAFELRRRLAGARLMLLFTPDACPPGSDPLEVLAAALPEVDLVQVRVKGPGDAVSPAAELESWALRVLEVAADASDPPLVLVNDRVDVAMVLEEAGVAGVHVGADDCPATPARELLGGRLLLGLSTHSAGDVAAAELEPVDYLGFGPVFPTRTKGYERGHGAEAAWIASAGTSRPVFPIGGIDATNAAELARVGRAAVCRAVLAAPDPAQAARELRELLTG